MQDLIPLYSADSELQDWISEQRMARLDRLGLIRIVRHKKGLVSRCILHRRPGDSRPMRLSAYLSSRYSYLQHLDCGRWVWTLRKLRTREESHGVRQAHVAHVGFVKITVH